LELQFWLYFNHVIFTLAYIDKGFITVVSWYISSHFAVYMLFCEAMEVKIAYIP